jgi:hypothetical protein
MTILERLDWIAFGLVIGFCLGITLCKPRSFKIELTLPRRRISWPKEIDSDKEK